MSNKFHPSSRLVILRLKMGKLSSKWRYAVNQSINRRFDRNFSFVIFGPMSTLSLIFKHTPREPNARTSGPELGRLKLTSQLFGTNKEKMEFIEVLSLTKKCENILYF